MTNNRAEGIVNQAVGSIKEVGGKLSGDAKLQAEGKAQKLGGKVQNAVGGAQDAVKDVANRK